MKRTLLLIAFAIVVTAIVSRNPFAQNNQINAYPGLSAGEYATVRFMEERTSIIWADGTVENVMDIAAKKKFEGGEKYPKGSDFRMYWLTIAMNHMSQRGFEFVYMNDKDVVMVRKPKRS